jgi:TolB-like protein
MPSIIEGCTYDIFISYRQKDNKGYRWVSEFVDALKTELEATFKEDISIYFDENPKDGLLETHIVDESLAKKLKCLIFIPIISQTYCDPKSYAWQHEFCVFNKLAKEDKFGRDIRLASGNVSSRILPVKIHDLDPEDKTLLETELGGVLRCVEFIYKSAGVNRPLRANEDHPQDNLNKTYYPDQINKLANAVKEIVTAIKKQDQQIGDASKQVEKAKPAPQKNLRTKAIIVSLFILVLIVVGYFFIPKLFKSSEPIEKSVAVLPFVNLSNDPEQEYFSDGMVDAILDHLYKEGDLKVIARTTSMRYKNTKLTLKEIARELGVSTLLEGSVQKIGNKVRITAQLIDPKTGFHLWSETFDRDLSDVFSIQSEVAQNVARELKSTMSAEETDLIQSEAPTTSQLAYDFYLKGNDYWSRFNASLALDMYTKAINEDSLFALAYARRALINLYIYWNKVEGWQGHVLDAKEDIEKGEFLNPKLLDIKFVKAVFYYWLDRNYDKSIKILKELKTEAPNMADLYAFVSYNLKRQGKWEESVNEAKRSIQLDPFNANYIDNLLQTYDLLHQYDNVIESSRQGLSLIPDYKSFNIHLFNAYLKKTADLMVALKESGLKEEDVQYQVLYYNRQYGNLIEFISKQTNDISSQYEYQPKTFRLALAYYLNSDKSLCKIYADSAITHLKEKLKEMPDDDRLYATLGKCLAFNGNMKEAIVCGKKAIDLKPIKLDAYQGSVREGDLMEIFIFTGNYDLALDKIEFLLSIPSWLSVGGLIINPIFDNLRNIPRFKKILATEHKTTY